ncbi:MAG: hypothetical protein Q4E87_03270 [bacterium]|nr:hypothetical protein [bacterium]
MKKNKVTALMIALSMTVLPTLAGSNFSVTAATPVVNTQYQQYQQVPYTPTANQPLKGSIVVVPAGTSMNITTTSTLSSETASLGQAVTAVLASNFYYNNVLVAPAGSTLQGNVTLAKKGNHAGINGQLQVRFTQIVTPYGNIIPISAMIKTTDGTGILVAGTAKDSAKTYVKDIGVGAGAGALAGLVGGAISGGSVGKGAALGTAIGGGIGVAKSLWSKGDDVEIPANSTVEITIDQPVTVNSAN